MHHMHQRSIGKCRPEGITGYSASLLGCISVDHVLACDSCTLARLHLCWATCLHVTAAPWLVPAQQCLAHTSRGWALAQR